MKTTCASVLLVAGLLGLPPSGRPGQQPQGTAAVKITVLGNRPFNGGVYLGALRVFGQDALLIDDDHIWQSLDGGHTWMQSASARKLGAPTSFSGAWLEGPAHVSTISDEGVVFESADAGRVWNRLGSIARPSGEFLAVAGDRTANRLVAVGSRSVPRSRAYADGVPKYAEDVSSVLRMLIPAIVTSKDAGKTWQSALLPSAIGNLDTIIVTGNSAIALGPYSVEATTDGGESWHLMRQSRGQSEEEGYPTSAAIWGDQVWVGLKNGFLLKGQIRGRTLGVVSKASFPWGNLIFRDPCEGYAIIGDDISRTADGGVTWQTLTHSGDIEVMAESSAGIFAVTHDHIVSIDVASSRPVRCSESAH